MKLSDKQRDRLWGENGPHSRARLVFESKIFDDEISENILLIEVSINPFTREIIEKAKLYFKYDPRVQELIENSYYQGDDKGYVAMICFGECNDELVLKKAQEYMLSIQKSLIRMHEYVIDILERME